MMLTLEQIRAAYTEEEALTDILEVLESAGFELGAWQTGVIRATVLRALAKFVTIIQPFADALSRIHFNADATDTGLTHYSRENWGNERIEAKSTIGVERFTGGAVGPPYTINAGDIVVSDGTRTFRTTGYYYLAGVRTVGPFVIPQGGYIDAEIAAEVPGEDSNDVANDTIKTMVTTYAGVTCSNPAFGATSTWITTNGSNDESDAALRERNSASVGTMSVLETIDDRYEWIARTALANARVRVDSSNPRGPFTVDVWVAAASEQATSDERQDVQDAVDASAFGAGRVLVAAALTHQVAPTGTVYYTGDLSAVQTAVLNALRDYVNTAPIGGFNLSPGPSNIIPEDGLTAAIRSATGVVGVALTGGETTLGTFEVALLGEPLVLTWTQVTG